jgi:Tripartite tricarboxylate transporter TctB family
MTIRAPKDFWSGVMFIAFAAVALIAARGYSLGIAGKMGPGYFPLLLGGVLALIGAFLVVRSLAIDGELVGRLSIVPLFVVAIAVFLFGAFIERLGLFVALVVVTLGTALASKESRLLESGVLAVTLAAFSVGIFVLALRLPLPVWPTF